MVVVIIIGILAAIVAPNVIGNVDKANVTKAKSEIRAMESALKLYRLDNFAYPTTEQGLEALIKKPNDPNIRNWNPGGYMERSSIPLDPWGNPYQYLNPGNNGAIDVATGGTLSGELTLLGVTKPVSFEIKKIGEGKDPWGGYRAGFEGSYTLARSDFGMSYNLGPAAENVEVELMIEAIKQ